MNIYLVIPSFNEGERLVATIKKSLDILPPERIIVVDDASINPERIPDVHNLWLLRHRINLGKGAAMRTGADFAFDQGASHVIFMDGDCQHDPKEIHNFIDFFNQGYDMVFGSRRPDPKAPLIRTLGKKLSSLYVQMVCGLYISDVLSGFRGLSKSTYELLKWKTDRYGVETEMVVRLSLNKKAIKWIEFPIDSVYIDKYKGVTVFDAIKLLFSSITWKIS